MSDAYAFFDFDGTLVGTDSFRLLARVGFQKNPLRFCLFLLLLPLFLVAGVLRWDRTFAKSIVLWSLTVGKTKKGCVRFLSTCLLPYADGIWFTEADAHIRQLHQDNIKTVVITASGALWVRSLLNTRSLPPWSRVLGTRLAFWGGGVVMAWPNCYQEKKVRRLVSVFGQDILWHSAYSDHPADTPMLVMAQNAYIISPKPKHMGFFERTFAERATLWRWVMPGSRKKTTHKE